MAKRERKECAVCGKVGKVAEDQTDPAADELACDTLGVAAWNEWVCGECLEAAEDAELVCCVCGEGIVPDSEYRCVATDHGPDYCCEDCEYTGDE